MSKNETGDRYQPTTVTCPAGVCSRTVPIFDHDQMFGHLLSDHRWSFDTSQSWVVENMPEAEARKEERAWESRYLDTDSNHTDTNIR